MKIAYITGSDDCDCCGYYTWCKITIKYDNDEKYYYADNHLGPSLPCDVSELGTPNCHDSWLQGYVRALKDMGREPIIDTDIAE